MPPKIILFRANVPIYFSAFQYSTAIAGMHAWQKIKQKLSKTLRLKYPNIVYWKF